MKHHTDTLSVDIVIPVYNAPALTRDCIDSVIRYLGRSIGTVWVHNDASNSETCHMLEDLSYQQVNVHHAPENKGYGQSVNEAMARSKADLVLVLNSDTLVTQNFLPLLCRVFVKDPELAVINPVENGDLRYDREKYMTRPGGYIATYRLQGYAFLIRRKLFLDIGGFDPQFGRGYFEDTDLGRRLVQQGWYLGIHPEAHIHHVSGASFGRGRSYRALAKQNRSLYLRKYPMANDNVLLISKDCALGDFPIELEKAVQNLLQQGGSIFWLTPTATSKLSCLQMRNQILSVGTILRLMLRGKSRTDKRISEIWVLPGISVWVRILLQMIKWFRRQMEVRHWKTATSKLTDSIF